MRNGIGAVATFAPLLWLAAFSKSTAAQEDVSQPAATGGTLEEIMVTAQRRVESINEVGLAIQAFDAASLEALRIDSVADLTSVVPSFTVSQSYQGVPTYTMRGIGFNTINLSATSTVGTYVDEVAYAYPIMNTGPLMDLARVEVLTTFEAAATADIGNYQTYNVGGYISGPLSERIQARVAVRSETSGEGWQRSSSRGERLGEIEKHGVRGSLAIQPSDGTQIDLSATYWRNQSDTVAGQGIGFTPATANSPFNAPGLVGYIANNVPNDARDADWAPEAGRSTDLGIGQGLRGPLREDNPFTGLKLRIDQDLSSSVKLVSLSSYNEFERDALLDWSGAPYEILLQRATGKIRSLAEDLHIEGETDRMNWLLGAYYAKDEILDSNRTLLGQNANVTLIRTAGLPLLATPFNCCGYTAADLSRSFRTYEDVGHIDTETWSVFTNVGWELNELLKLNAGVRYTQDRQDYRGCSRDFNGSMLPNVNVVNRALYLQNYGILAAPVSAGQCHTFDPATGTFHEIFSTLDESNVAWRASLDYTPSDSALLYASVSRGAKAGTTPINPANIARQNAPVKQELLTAYELGLKATAAERTLQTNLAAFFYDYEDKQIGTYFADPIYTALTRLDNVPKAQAYGLESDITWQPLDGITVAATALWLQTEVKNYVGTNAAGQPQDYDGAEFIYSPEFQASLSFIYARSLSGGLGLEVTLNGRYQSESNTIFEDIDLYKVPDYSVANVSVGVRGAEDRWSFSLWSRNVLDEYYWTAVASNANVVVRFPSPPRTYGATIGVRF
jgi:outer membrane receptor protein involved in Fe transport